VTGYELVRATWHLALFGRRAVWAAVSRGPRSAACFERVLAFAMRLGVWRGLVGQLRRRGGWWGRRGPPAARPPVEPALDSSPEGKAW
jgi:hypothetical protein